MCNEILTSECGDCDWCGQPIDIGDHYTVLDGARDTDLCAKCMSDNNVTYEAFLERGDV